LQFYYVSVADAAGLLITPGLPSLIIGLDRVDGNKYGFPIFRCSLDQTPLMLALKVVFGKLLTKPKEYTKFEVIIFSGCTNK